MIVITTSDWCHTRYATLAENDSREVDDVNCNIFLAEIQMFHTFFDKKWKNKQARDN